MGNLSLEDSTSTLHRVVNSNVYLVEKMLRKKGDKIYMKWLGFDNSTLIYKRIVCYKNKIYYKLYNYWEYALILKDFQEMAQLVLSHRAIFLYLQSIMALVFSMYHFAEV